MTDTDDTAERNTGQEWIVSYGNDVGPDDDYYHEWATVGPLDFGIQVHDYDVVRRADTSRRLAAAWNACEGIPTEVLEDGVVSDMLEALRMHQAWSDSEDAGPDYGGQSRDTHPDGEKIWRAWFDGNLDLCDRASRATRAAIAKATGGAA